MVGALLSSMPSSLLLAVAAVAAASAVAAVAVVVVAGAVDATGAVGTTSGHFWTPPSSAFAAVLLSSCFGGGHNLETRF